MHVYFHQNFFSQAYLIGRQIRCAQNCYTDLQTDLNAPCHDLKGNIKIIRKPRPVWNKIKNMFDALLHIVMNLELNDGRKTHFIDYD